MEESTQPGPSNEGRARERTFVRRDRPVVLRELTNLEAVYSTSARGEPPESAIPPEVAHLLPQAQVEAFERQGWRFQPPSAQAAPADTRQTTGPSQARVYLGRGDRVLLGTNTLTLKLRSAPASDDEANRILAPFGVRVVERLPFGRGVYRVAIESPVEHDAIDVANKLATSGLVEFSEPELIEAIGTRTPPEG